MYSFEFNGNETVPVFKPFIKEHMPELAGNDIKVYLYALYLASEKQSISPEELSEATGISAEDIEKSIGVLIKRSLITKKADRLLFAVPGTTGHDNPAVYTQKTYLDTLSDIMGGRQFTSGEITSFIDMKEVFRLPEEVIYMMVEYVVSPSVRGKRVSVRYLEKMALAWAEENIRTVKKAERKIASHAAVSSGAFQIINALYGGNRRLPNEAEMQLYEKWTKEMGFTFDAVMSMVREASLVQNPSMKYLDAVVQSYYDRGIIRTSDIVADKENKEIRREELKEVLTAIRGARKIISPTLETMYQEWRRMGFSQNAILCACEYTVNSGYHSYKKVDQMLKSLSEKGITADKAVADKLSFRTKDDMFIHQMMEVAGISGNITETDRKIYYYVSDNLGMSHEMILLAADMSSLKKDPRSYMYTLLKSWAESGITTKREAQGAKAPRKTLKPEGIGREIDENSSDEGDAIYK